MRTIGTAENGNIIVELTDDERDFLDAREAFRTALDALHAKVRDTLHRQKPAARGVHRRRAVATPRPPAVRLPRPAVKLKPPASGVKRSREKVCAICAARFHDDSRTNTRKTCGNPDCKKALERRSWLERGARQRRRKKEAAKVEQQPAAAEPGRLRKRVQRLRPIIAALREASTPLTAAAIAAALAAQGIPVPVKAVSNTIYKNRALFDKVGADAWRLAATVRRRTVADIAKADARARAKLAAQQED